MPGRVTKVFLSSTAKDLKEYREAVYKAVNKMIGYHCVNMENFGARPDAPAEVCRDEVRDCDIFVGILGPLYGSCPPDSELSFTEIEYQAAFDFDKPRLMFIAPDAIPLPANLRETDAKHTRQKEFLKRVGNDLVSDSFSTPDELATLVSTAITNLERKARGALKKVKVEQKKLKTAQQKSAPNPSKNVPRMCDRKKQEAIFVNYLRLASKYRPGFPLACVVHGEESENHKSFVQRLCNTRIQEYANVRSGKQGGNVKHVPGGDWPYADNRASQQEMLKSYLFMALDPHFGYRGEEHSAAALRKLLDQSLNSVVVFEHKMKAEHWDGETAGLLRWYLEFWDEVKGDAALPQCFIFFKVVYPDARRGSLWNVWRRLRRANPLGIKGRVWRAARGLSGSPERAIDPQQLKDSERARAMKESATHCAFALLDELTCVEKEHVMEWLGDHLGSDDEGEIERHAIKIMTDEWGRFRKCRNMREVESHLNTIHRQTTGLTARA